LKEIELHHYDGLEYREAERYDYENYIKVLPTKFEKGHDAEDFH